ncbi:MAG: AbrB/MazE/SpoVT family DNA-binding domain-containing protein [Gammaproteobacteria bacterium]
MSETRLSSKGQITLPRDIREYLKVKLGDKLRFRITDNGQVTVETTQYHIGELYGLLRREEQNPVSVSAMDEAVRNRFKAPR